MLKRKYEAVNKEEDLGEGMLLPWRDSLLVSATRLCLSTHFSHMAIVWKGLMFLYLTEYV